MHYYYYASKAMKVIEQSMVEVHICVGDNNNMSAFLSHPPHIYISLELMFVERYHGTCKELHLTLEYKSSLAAEHAAASVNHQGSTRESSSRVVVCLQF